MSLKSVLKRLEEKHLKKLLEKVFKKNVFGNILKCFEGP